MHFKAWCRVHLKKSGERSVFFALFLRTDLMVAFLILLLVPIALLAQRRKLNEKYPGK